MIKHTGKKMGIGLWEVISAIFFTGIFFIPFNAYDGPDFLGEMQNEAAVIFFFIVFVLLIFSTLFSKKFYIPYNNLLFQLVVLLFLWFAVATLLNGNNVLEYYFKKTSGPKRFLRQYISLIISGAVFFITYYNVFRRYNTERLFFKIRRVFFYSMIFVTVYGVIEILIVKFKILPLYNVLRLFDYFPFTSVYLDFRLDRISSVTFEPPALATYLFTVAGWMFSYIITGKGLKKYVPALAVVALAFFSESRAGMFVILLQIAVFFLVLAERRRYHQTLIKIGMVLMVVGVLAGVVKGKEIVGFAVEKLTSFAVSDGTHQLSNKSRFGLQYAMFKTFQEFPVSGTGFGQQTYEAKKYYPSWATKDNWEFRVNYLNEDNPRFPPGYNVYLRLLAETGIIGLFIFLTLLFFIVYTCLVMMRRSRKHNVIIAVILISMVGFYMNWLKGDTFRVFGFWINLAFLIKIMHSSKFKYRVPNKYRPKQIPKPD